MSLVLFRLKRFDVGEHIVEVLLSGRIFDRIEIPKTGSPHGHIVRPVRSDVSAKLHKRPHIARRKLAVVASSERRQIRRWRLQRDEESRETRLREGDGRHAVGCAATQANGIEDVNIRELEEARGNAAGRNVAEGFSMMSGCSLAARGWIIPLLGLMFRRP